MSMRPGRLAEPMSGRTWEAQEIHARVGARVTDYQQLGLARGERVLLHYGNTLEFFVDLLAIWHLGACAIPLDSRLTPFETETLARAARPRVSVWAHTPDPAIGSALASLGVHVIGKPEPRRSER